MNNNSRLEELNGKICDVDKVMRRINEKDPVAPADRQLYCNRLGHTVHRWETPSEKRGMRIRE